MDEYIKKTDALKIIDEVHGQRSAYHRVRNIPAADVAPMRHGQWVKEDDISIPELAKALRRIKTLDELRCMGCGCEHDCSIHGCVIIRQAADVIEAMSVLLQGLKIR